MNKYTSTVVPISAKQMAAKLSFILLAALRWLTARPESLRSCANGWVARSRSRVGVVLGRRKPKRRAKGYKRLLKALGMTTGLGSKMDA